MDEKTRPYKDNKEFLLSRRKFLLSTIAAMGLASMTPIVSIARAASPEEHKGLMISTIIEDVRMIDRKTYKVVYVSSVTKIVKGSESKVIKNNTYVIRGLSGKVFEPLVSITYGDKTTVFAYADDDEFIAETVSGWNDLLIIREVVSSKAKTKGLRKLERFTTLIERAVIESEISP